MAKKVSVRIKEDPLQKNTSWLSLWCVLGILLSIYTLYVELRHAKDPRFVALCDINDQVSCTKVFTSSYGKGFGLLPKGSPFNLPNPVYGIFFYITQLFIAMFCGRDNRLINLLTFSAIISNVMSVYLGYVLFVILKDVCVVCITTYFVNFFMLIACLRRKQLVNALSRTKRD